MHATDARNTQVGRGSMCRSDSTFQYAPMWQEEAVGGHWGCNAGVAHIVPSASIATRKVCEEGLGKPFGMVVCCIEVLAHMYFMHARNTQFYMSSMCRSGNTSPYTDTCGGRRRAEGNVAVVKVWRTSCFSSPASTRRQFWRFLGLWLKEDNVVVLNVWRACAPRI